MKQLIAREDFKKLIPPLTAEEKEQLEANIIADGCRDAIVTWDDVILDGHNRYKICTRNGIEFKTIEMQFGSEEEAKDWMDRNQLGRRNLTPDQRRIIIGRRYNREKKAAHGRDGRTFSGDQNDTPKTADRIAEESAVSAPTVKRYAKDAQYYEQMQEAEPELAKQVWNGETTLSKVIQGSKKKEAISKLESIAQRHAEDPTGEYDVIVIDPPWPMKKIDRDVRPNQVEFDYPTMTEEELKQLEIPAAKDSHLWLWTTNKYLPMALRLMQYWDFKYICTFVWHKPGGPQPFNLPQYNCEFALYGHKGNPPFVETKDFFLCFNAKRKEHSVKPEEFYNTVIRVTKGRRLDMFGRRKINGFDSWGNEV